MGLEFNKKSYSNLKEEFNSICVPNLFAKHEVDTTDKLNYERKTPVQLIQAVIAELDNPSNKDFDKKKDYRLKVLAGTLLIVRDFIDATYLLRSNTRKSQLFSDLTQILGISKDNQLDKDQVADAAAKAVFFVKKAIYTTQDSAKQLKANHIFSDIEGCGKGASGDCKFLREFLEKGLLLQARNDLEHFDDAVASVKAINPGQTSRFGRLFSGSASASASASKAPEESDSDNNSVEKVAP